MIFRVPRSTWRLLAWVTASTFVGLYSPHALADDPTSTKWRSELGRRLGPQILEAVQKRADVTNAWEQAGRPPLPPIATTEAYQAWRLDLARIHADVGARAPQSLGRAWQRDLLRLDTSIRFLRGLAADLEGGAHHVAGVIPTASAVDAPLRLDPPVPVPARMRRARHTCGTHSASREGLGLVANAGHQSANGSFVNSNLWRGGKTIHVALDVPYERWVDLERERWLEMTVPYWAKIWENYANITFQFGPHRVLKRHVSSNSPKWWEFGKKETRTSLLRPTPWPKDADLRVTAKKHKRGPYWSAIGPVSRKGEYADSTMNFQGVDRDARPHRIVQHEFGHALGFEHEHSSPARPPRLFTEATLSARARQSLGSKATDEAIKEHIEDNLQQLDGEKYVASKYDIHSIMHYRFALKDMKGGLSDLAEELATEIEAAVLAGQTKHPQAKDKKLEGESLRKWIKEHGEIGGAHELSLMDMYWAGVFYPKWQPAGQGRTWSPGPDGGTVNNALEAAQAAPWLSGLPAAYQEGFRDVPLAGDFDADGRADIGSVMLSVRRPSKWGPFSSAKGRSRGGYWSLRRNQGVFEKGRTVPATSFRPSFDDGEERPYGIFSRSYDAGADHLETSSARRAASRHHDYFSRHYYHDGSFADFGSAGHQPLVGDLDGDGLDDLVVADRKNGRWLWRRSDTRKGVWRATKQERFADENAMLGRKGRKHRFRFSKVKTIPDQRLARGLVWPLIADFDGDGRDELGVVTYGKDGGALSVREVDGQEDPASVDLPGWFTRSEADGEAVVSEIPFAGEFDDQPGADLGRLLVSQELSCLDSGTETGALLEILPNAGGGRFDTGGEPLLAQGVRTYGANGATPVVGDFDGAGADEIALVQPRRWVFGKSIGPIWDWPGARWIILQVAAGPERSAEDHTTPIPCGDVGGTKALRLLWDFDDLLGGRIAADGVRKPARARRSRR